MARQKVPRNQQKQQAGKGSRGQNQATASRSKVIDDNESADVAVAATPPASKAAAKSRKKRKILTSVEVAKLQAKRKASEAASTPRYVRFNQASESDC